jgi:hypothetical protein
MKKENATIFLRKTKTIKQPNEFFELDLLLLVVLTLEAILGFFAV